MDERISITTDKCTGCRSCEIVCSYHFKRTFQPDASRIRILFDVKSGDMNISIDCGCDYCEDEKEPLCVKYCAAGALILERGRD